MKKSRRRRRRISRKSSRVELLLLFPSPTSLYASHRTTTVNDMADESETPVFKPVSPPFPPTSRVPPNAS